jgi:hypothetical protein
MSGWSYEYQKVEYSAKNMQKMVQEQLNRTFLMWKNVRCAWAIIIAGGEGVSLVYRGGSSGG